MQMLSQLDSYVDMAARAQGGPARCAASCVRHMTEMCPSEAASIMLQHPLSSHLCEPLAGCFCQERVPVDGTLRRVHR